MTIRNTQAGGGEEEVGLKIHPPPDIIFWQGTTVSWCDRFDYDVSRQSFRTRRDTNQPAVQNQTTGSSVVVKDGYAVGNGGDNVWVMAEKQLYTPR